MADDPPETIVSNPETQLNGDDTVDVNMSTNEVLPATALEADPQPQDPSTPPPAQADTTSAMPPPPPFSIPTTPASTTADADLTDPSDTAPPPILANGTAQHLSNGTTTTTTTDAPPLSSNPSTATAAPPASNIPAPASKPHSPAPTRGSTPAPAASLSTIGPSHIIGSVNGEAGSPTRAYINQKVTPTLLEGMKWLARNEPEKPLKWLGEFLLARSREVEGP